MLVLRWEKGEEIDYIILHKTLNWQTEFIRVILIKEWDLLPEVSLWEAVNIENELI